MPIRPEMRARYPADWSQIRAAVMERARGRCEWCDVPQYAVGYRNECGAFVPGCGNGPWDAAGQGLTWPSLEPLTYAEAKGFADFANCCIGGCDDAGRHWIVIVLTTAHIHDDAPENADLANLAALCQRCHNRHDASARAAGIRARRTSAQLTLATLTPEEPHE